MEEVSFGLPLCHHGQDKQLADDLQVAFERLAVCEIAIDPYISLKAHEGIAIPWRRASSNEVAIRRSIRCSEGQSGLSMSDNRVALLRSRMICL